MMTPWARRIFLLTTILSFHQVISMNPGAKCELPDTFQGKCDGVGVENTDLKRMEFMEPGTRCFDASKAITCLETGEWEEDESVVPSHTMGDRQKRGGLFGAIESIGSHVVGAVKHVVAPVVEGVGSMASSAVSGVSHLLFPSHHGVDSIIAPVLTPVVDFAQSVVCGITHLLCPKSAPRPNTPPYIHCPKVDTKVAAMGQTSAVVKWGAVSASDAEDGSLTPNLLTTIPKNNVFEEGDHFMQYTATDSKGFSVFCDIQVTVKVKRCQPIQWPSNAAVNCANGYKWGDKCSLICDEGYEPSGATEAQCEGDRWSTYFRCKEINCAADLNVDNGTTYCTFEPPTYKSTCSVTCDKGFGIKGPSMVVCNKNGSLSAPGKCVDVEPPEFTNGCPQNIEEYSEKSRAAKMVHWRDPDVADNNGKNVTITSTPSSGQLFLPGVHTVTIVAKDAAGNEASCSFVVNIRVPTCNYPDLDKSGKDLVLYHCPKGMVYGDTCTMSCKSGYPLEGPKTTTCEIYESTNPPTFDWTSNGTHCKISHCGNLSIPVNGALSCAGWGHGPMCMMQCNDNWDVPRTVPDQYVCGESDGKWRPNDNVQDCIVKKRAHSMNLPSDLYYYSGSCFNETTKDQIRENTVKMLKSNTQFKEKCGGEVPNCKPEFVSVKCGEISSKKRAAKKEVIITFNIIIPFEDDGTPASELLNSHIATFTRIEDAIDKAIASNTLDIAIPGLVLQHDPYAPGLMSFYCGKGTKPSPDTGTCSGCPTGTMYDESVDDCTSCPKGYFQDEGHATVCKKCPDGTTTEGNGSRRSDDCKPTCDTGHQSKLGIVPCSPCPIGSYQDLRGMTTCKQCPLGQSTFDEGSRGVKDCIDFDTEASDSKEKVIGTLHEEITSFSIYFWIRVQHNSPRSHIKIKHPSLTGLILDIAFDGTVTVSVHGILGTTCAFDNCPGSFSEKFDTAHVPVTDEWIHVVATFDATAEIINVFTNGVKVVHRSISSVVAPPVVEGSSVIMDFDVKASVSHLNVLGHILDNLEVDRISSVCGLHANGTSMSERKEALTVTTKCDAINECESSPCGKHRCHNLVGGYSCSCNGGYSGEKCDIPPDHCEYHLCEHNSYCVNNYSNYTCSCRSGYRGTFCHQVIVNGGWSEWTPWTSCSVTCGGGTKSRARECVNPPPDPDGKACDGDATESESCNAIVCPSCIKLGRSFGVVKNCTHTQGVDLIQCTLSCRKGLMFAQPVLSVYQCGKATNYKWPHQTKDNPNAELPKCASVATVRAFSVHRQLTFTNMPCDIPQTTKENLVKQLKDTFQDIQCMKEDTCTTSTQLVPCTESQRRKRDTGVNANVVLKTKEGSLVPLNITMVVKDKPNDSNLKTYFAKVANFEISAQQLVNASKSLLQLTVGGVKYVLDPASGTTTVDIVCAPGTVPTQGMGICGECPQGSREVDGKCELCPRGSYQPNPASTSCLSCPSGTTTGDVGSTSPDDCLDNDNNGAGGDISGSDDKGASTERILVIVLPTVSSVILMLAVIAIAWKLKGGLKRSSSTILPTTKFPLPPPYLASDVASGIPPRKEFLPPLRGQSQGPAVASE